MNKKPDCQMFLSLVYGCLRYFLDTLDTSSLNLVCWAFQVPPLRSGRDDSIAPHFARDDYV